MVLAFAVFLTYSQLLATTVAFVRKGQTQDGMLIWSVHIGYFLLACYCLYRRNFNLPLLPEIRLPKKLYRKTAA